jgi:hypothetical protein
MCSSLRTSLQYLCMLFKKSRRLQMELIHIIADPIQHADAAQMSHRRSTVRAQSARLGTPVTPALSWRMPGSPPRIICGTRPLLQAELKVHLRSALQLGWQVYAAPSCFVTFTLHVFSYILSMSNIYTSPTKSRDTTSTISHWERNSRSRMSLFKSPDPFYSSPRSSSRLTNRSTTPSPNGSHSDISAATDPARPPIILGICAMDVKARSKAMREILTRIVERSRGTIDVKVFGDKVILDEGMFYNQNPCLLSFISFVFFPSRR